MSAQKRGAKDFSKSDQSTTLANLNSGCLEDEWKGLTPAERLSRRQEHMKPLVEAYFAWVKGIDLDTVLSEKTKDGLQYSINQEKHLRAFLEDGEVPIDNSASERSIRPFCVGRSNWHVIDSIKGAQASAIVYSIVETAKANNLKPYEYLQHLPHRKTALSL